MTVETEPHFTPYSVGLVHASVCADKALPKERVEALMNQHNPTGIESRWQIVEPTFSGGEPNPCPCSEKPDDYLHWLFTC